MKHYFFVFVLVLIFVQCKTDRIKRVDLSDVQINAEFVDFHKQFQQLKPSEFSKFKKKYSLLFPSSVPDSIWLSKLYDVNEKLLFTKVDSVFGDCSEIEAELVDLFKHIKYYKPSFNSPKTFSVITNLDYESSVVYVDSLLFISLDMFLGADSDVYASFPKYLTNNYTKAHLGVSVASEIIKKEFHFNNGRTFLDRMIYQGKVLFLLQSLLPQVTRKEILGYEEAKFQWALLNESQIWAYFISNELLYSTDQKLNARFINTAPFSKFYLDMDKESPGGIACWIGWNIVDSYMRNNKKSLQELLKMDTETIFRKSKYKPKK
ncbi:gliding motility lipoprotein GldB [Bacteroidota bacterium]